MTRTKTTEWYELLLARTPGWRPNIEDIIDSNYETAVQKSLKHAGPAYIPLTRPRAEFDAPTPKRNPDTEVTRLEVVQYFMDLEVEGIQRTMRLYDIVHMCRLEVSGDKRMIGTSDMLVVPRERIMEFQQLTKRQIKSDPRQPDWCMVDLAQPFAKSFAFNLVGL